MSEPVAHACGQQTTAEAHVIDVPNVLAIRQRLGITHAAFAKPI